MQRGLHQNKPSSLIIAATEVLKRLIDAANLVELDLCPIEKKELRSEIKLLSPPSQYTTPLNSPFLSESICISSHFSREAQSA
jgi:hypothetical protein